MQKVFQRCFEAIHSHTMVRQLDQNVPGKIGEGSPAGYTHPRERGSKAYQGPADIITSDVVETVASVAETSSKVRARGFIKNSVTRDFKVSGFCRNFSKNVVITFKLNFFRISVISPPCNGCFLPANTTDKMFLNGKSFTKPYPCDFQSLKTIGL